MLVFPLILIFLILIFFTVMLQVYFFFLTIAVTLAFPFLLAVTVPFFETEATLELLLIHLDTFFLDFSFTFCHFERVTLFLFKTLDAASTVIG